MDSSPNDESRALCNPEAADSEVQTSACRVRRYVSISSCIFLSTCLVASVIAASCTRASRIPDAISNLISKELVTGAVEKANGMPESTSVLTERLAERVKELGAGHQAGEKDGFWKMQVEDGVPHHSSTGPWDRRPRRKHRSVDDDADAYWPAVHTIDEELALLRNEMKFEGSTRFRKFLYDRLLVKRATTESNATKRTESKATKRREEKLLFCFIVAFGREIPLVQHVYSLKTSIFACDGWEVFSPVAFALGPSGPNNTVFHSPPSRRVLGSLANAPVFAYVWQLLLKAGQIQKFKWVLKADADAVFLPERLRPTLLAHLEPGPVFVRNCHAHYSMQGPLEILSGEAVAILSDGGLALCRRHIPMREIQSWEDFWLKSCLTNLEVRAVRDWQLLFDQKCNSISRTVPLRCADKTLAAFHPAKTVLKYERCYNQTTKKRGTVNTTMPQTRIFGQEQETTRQPKKHELRPLA